MKKNILISVLIFLGITTFAQNNGWKSHTSCESNEKPVANPEGAFTTTWTTSTQNSTQNEGPQNHYNGNVNAGGNVGVANVGGNASVSRDGEKTTNNNGNSSTTTTTVKYDCVPADKK